MSYIDNADEQVGDFYKNDLDKIHLQNAQCKTNLRYDTYAYQLPVNCFAVIT
jgi:hypothetical protein